MESEFAPEYTTRERWQHLCVGLVFGAGFYALCEWWLFPLLVDFSDHAVCETVFGVPGPSILFYGIFVGMPLLFAMVMGLVLGPTAFRSIKTRRSPPPGKKVYRPTRVRAGNRAVARALAQLIPTVLFIGIACWGYGAATKILNQAYASHPDGWSQCASDKTLVSVAKPLSDPLLAQREQYSRQ